ncbi:bacteriophage holin [Amycolatopsis sp. NPDC059027]|uniref:bacteriophage holin n=1 Tax=unclassified Amycolatopsis TaxID=2618356 RepID=UPI00366EBA87
MAFVLIAVLVVAGFLLLALVLVRVRRALRTYRRTVSMVSTNTQDRAGLLRARTAAVRVAINQRRPAPKTQ